MTFEAALKELLKHEGGFVNHPRDPGGVTNLGVTKRVWEAWVGRDVGEQEMRNLTPQKVAPLYYQRYWKRVKADQLPAGLALQVFDFGVNAGPKRAIRYLQLVVGANDDGLFGPKTMETVKRFLERYGERRAIERYADARMRYYRQLRTFKTFGRGWTRRTAEVRLKGIEWATS